MSPSEPNLVKGYLLAAGGAALFSMKAIIIKLAYGADGGQVAAITLLGLRMAFALPVFLAIGYWLYTRRQRSAAPDLSAGTIALCALVGLLGYYFAAYMDFIGLKYITAQLERLVLFTYPLYVMILGAVFFGGRITRWGILSLAICYCGVALVYLKGGIAEGEHVALGIALVLIAALAFALYQLLARVLILRVGSLVFTCIAMSSAAFASLLHMTWLHSHAQDMVPISALPMHVFAMAAALGILATVVPSFMINAGLGLIGAQASSMIHTISPVVTIVLAVAVLREPFTAIDAAGSLLVICGVGIYTWRDNRRAVSPVSGSTVLNARQGDRP